MPLTAADFDGFNPATVAATLRAFNSKAKLRGQEYFNNGRVHGLECLEPGVSYGARVRGGSNYQISLNFDGKTKLWLNICTCPLVFGCKHAYAALQQLQSEFAEADVHALSSSTAKRSAQAKPATPPRPIEFDGLVEQKLERPLTSAENKYLDAIRSLYRTASLNRAVFIRDLTPFGIPLNAGWWDKADLWPNFPDSEAEFWNYLAHYLDEHNIAIPDFLKPVTELGKIRDRMERHRRGKVVTFWTQQLSRLAAPTDGAGAETTSTPAELRVRFAPGAAQVEWRVAGGEWAALRSRKYHEFDQHHSEALSTEATMIWQPLFNNQSAHYKDGVPYADGWSGQLLNRWLRMTLLRPLLVNDYGDPLVFHPEPLRWRVSEPAKPDGDYSVQLVRANGSPAPASIKTFDGRPDLYLTSEGVFTGPPPQPHLLNHAKPTLIPAKAFETIGGLRLVEQLRTEPPPRLAAKIRTVALVPRVVAEIKQPWSGSETEYCHVEILGASEDGKHVERWNGQGWFPAHDLAPKNAMIHERLERVDRFALADLIPPMTMSGFKWDLSFYAGPRG